jgi:hypothetical protein
VIEHRLYGFERFHEHHRVATAGRIESKILICTPKYATMLTLQGWKVFDFHESLGLEPHFYETEQVNESSHIDQVFINNL